MHPCFKCNLHLIFDIKNCYCQVHWAEMVRIIILSVTSLANLEVVVVAFRERDCFWNTCAFTVARKKKISVNRECEAVI